MAKIKKIPYRLAVSLLEDNETKYCGYKVLEIPGEESWEVPIWKKYMRDTSFIFVIFSLNRYLYEKALRHLTLPSRIFIYT